MNATVLSKEKTQVKFSFELDAAKLEEGLDFAFKKNKDKISLPGFRKGKVPRKLVEAQYGEGFFYEDAISHIFPDAYMEAVKELGLDVVSQPSLDVDYIEKGKGVKFLIEVTVKPEVELGQYKGLEVEKEVVEVTDAEIESELTRAQEKNARMIEVTDRPAEMGDITKISYEGFLDGVPFEGGKAEDHDLELGSGMFIPGFEEKIVGHSIGEEFDIDVTFPEEYHAPDLAGKAVIFKIVLKGITKKELPALDDAFAEDVSDFATLDEYKADIKAKLAAGKEERAKQIQSEKLLDAAIANCTMEVPQVMFDNKIDSMLREFSENIMRQGLSVEMYYQYMGTNEEQLKETFKETAEKSVKARLMLETIAKVENIAISKEDLDAEVVKYGESYGIDGATMLQILQDEDKAALEEDMKVRAAVKLIEDTAIEK